VTSSANEGCFRKSFTKHPSPELLKGIPNVDVWRVLYLKGYKISISPHSNIFDKITIIVIIR
jgi:hypothetical protein